MEKPMTTSTLQARKLQELVQQYDQMHMGRDDVVPRGCFLINNSANYRQQARVAQSIVSSGRIGTIRHVSGFMASPLSWIFNDPANVGWNEIDPRVEDMVGNGFAWAQSSHLLAWIYHVCSGGSPDQAKDLDQSSLFLPLTPHKVFCLMNHSSHTSADISHSASVLCNNNVNMSISGTSLLPGHAHSDPQIGKKIRIKIFGTKGTLLYSGDDQRMDSGRLELLLTECGSTIFPVEKLGFNFENTEPNGKGPESLRSFIDACVGNDYYVGADVNVGMRAVQTIDAMYRSSVSGHAELVR